MSEQLDRITARQYDSIRLYKEARRTREYRGFVGYKCVVEPKHTFSASAWFTFISKEATNVETRYPECPLASSLCDVKVVTAYADHRYSEGDNKCLFVTWRDTTGEVAGVCVDFLQHLEWRNRGTYVRFTRVEASDRFSEAIDGRLGVDEPNVPIVQPQQQQQHATNVSWVAAGHITTTRPGGDRGHTGADVAAAAATGSHRHATVSVASDASSSTAQRPGEVPGAPMQVEQAAANRGRAEELQTEVTRIRSASAHRVAKVVAQMGVALDVSTLMHTVVVDGVDSQHAYKHGYILEAVQDVCESYVHTGPAGHKYLPLGNVVSGANGRSDDPEFVLPVIKLLTADPEVSTNSLESGWVNPVYCKWVMTPKYLVDYQAQITEILQSTLQEEQHALDEALHKRQKTTHV